MQALSLATHRRPRHEIVSSIEAGSTGGFARPLVDQLVGFDAHGGVNNAASRSREGSIDVDRWREAAR